MKIQCPKGTRDFYPPDMFIRNWVADRWRAVAVRSGFEEYDGPMFESLDLYRLKSGEGIVSELFSFEDRGGRSFALRPEMTPTLARMVAARAASLPQPIKWFSAPRLCRAERPQRGRLREFFQWNVDILGPDDVLADAECIFVAVDFFREVGLTSEHVVIKINSRRLVASLLEHVGVDPARHDALYAILDKRDKDPTAFDRALAEMGLRGDVLAGVQTMGRSRGPEGLASVASMLGGHEAGLAEVARLERLFELLDLMGVGPYCRFDMGVVRGLAYYTGVVFEGFGLMGLQRAICGGGRYDDLLSSLGGAAMSGTGFATSDVVIVDVLQELGALPEYERHADLFVIDANEDAFADVLRLSADLRRTGHQAVFSYKRQSVGKQLKQASNLKAKRAVIVGMTPDRRDVCRVKDLTAGAQTDVPMARLMDDPFFPIAT